MDRGPSPLPLNGPNSLSSYELYIRTLKPPALSRLKLIDTELQRLVYFIVRDFVSSWYSSVSTHDEFYSEVVQSLASVLAKIEARLLEIDIVGLSLKELPEIIDSHIREYRACLEIFGTPNDGGFDSLEDLFLNRQPHSAMFSPEARLDHLRAIMDLALQTWLPEMEVQAEALRFLVREVLAVTTVANALDKICEPDFVAEAILKFIEAFEAPASSEVLVEQPVEKPRTKRPWHRAVSSHTVLPVTKRELQVLSSSQNGRGDATNVPADVKGSPLKTWVSDKATTVAALFDDLLQSTVKLVIDASWNLVTQEEPITPVVDNQKNGSTLSVNATSVTDEMLDASVSSDPLKDSVPSMEPAIQPPTRTLRPLFAGLWQAYLKLSRWRHAAHNGPFQLGPIADTRAYADQNLCQHWLEFVVDVFGLRERESHGLWVWNQIRYVGEPWLSWYAGPGTLNRAALETVAELTSEPRIASYLRLLRAALWPGGQFIRNSVARSEEEKAALQKAALEALKLRIPAILRTILGNEYVDSNMEITFAAFQNKLVFQHLVFRLLDAIVVQLLGPELEVLSSITAPMRAPSAQQTYESRQPTPTPSLQSRSATPTAKPASIVTTPAPTLDEPPRSMLQSDIISSMESDIRDSRGFTPSPTLMMNRSPARTLRPVATDPLSAGKSTARR